MSTVIARRVVVHGRVQGVFFRDGARRAARAAGITGWVRNRPDGAVEGWFEGPAAGVEALVDWCRTGTPYSVVARVDVEEESAEGFADFRVL